MQTLTFKKWKRKLTPSGYGDNGLWVLSDDEVQIPKALLDDPATVIETVSLFTRGWDRTKSENKTKAWKISTGKRSWVVNKDPHK